MVRNFALIFSAVALAFTACSSSDSSSGADNDDALSSSTAKSSSSVTPASSATESSSSVTPESSSSLTPTSSASALSWTMVPFDDAAVRITGRADYSTTGAAKVSWSGSTFTLGFSGTAVKIHLTGGRNYFNVTVDGDTAEATVIRSASQDTLIFLAENLSAGPHYISVYKRTEAALGSATFKGFDVFGEANAAALPSAPTKKIEFIGNSITCGYGILANSQSDHWSDSTEDASKAYAGIAASLLGAEAHTISVSGRGYYRNSDGTTTETLPDYFDNTLYAADHNWDFSWIPDAVVINLGTNDFATGLPDSTTFVNSALSFIKTIRSKYPAAAIVLVDGPMLSDWFPYATATDSTLYPLSDATLSQNYIQTNGDIKTQTVCRRFLDAIKAARATDGDTNVYRKGFEVQGTLGLGADYHPSIAQGALNGKELAEWFRSELGW